MKTTKELKKKKYKAENKDRLRELIVNEIRKNKINSILTLESPEFLFSKLLPDKKIIVWENNADVIKKMEKKTPKNVELIFGNIGKFGIFKSKVDMIYLDFCGTWMTEQSEIVRLKDSLKQVKLFAITLYMRESAYHQQTGNTFEGDYQFDLIKKIQDLTEINWKVIYGESYYDSVQMVTIILKQSEETE